MIRGDWGLEKGKQVSAKHVGKAKQMSHEIRRVSFGGFTKELFDHLAKSDEGSLKLETCVVWEGD